MCFGGGDKSEKMGGGETMVGKGLANQKLEQECEEKKSSLGKRESKVIELSTKILRHDIRKWRLRTIRKTGRHNL